MLNSKISFSKFPKERREEGGEGSRHKFRTKGYDMGWKSTVTRRFEDASILMISGLTGLV